MPSSPLGKIPPLASLGMCTFGTNDTPFQFAPATLAAIETTLLNPLNKELIPLTTKLTPFSILEIT